MWASGGRTRGTVAFPGQHLAPQPPGRRLSLGGQLQRWVVAIDGDNARLGIHMVQWQWCDNVALSSSHAHGKDATAAGRDIHGLSLLQLWP